MRKDYGPKPYFYPQPVMILAAYDENGKANAMNAAWGGISDDQEISICLSADHKTTKNLLHTGYFTVSVGESDYVEACDYLGIETGNKEENKLEKAGFHVLKATHVNAPMIEELAVCMECKVISYDPESCRLRAEIINVSVDESVLTDGKVDLHKLQPISFDPFNLTYVKLTETVAKAFSCGKIKK